MFKKIVKGFLFLSLFLSVMAVVNVYADQSTEGQEDPVVLEEDGVIKLSRYELNHIPVNGTTPKDDYWTGEIISFYAGFSLSGDSSSLSGSVLELHIPKEYLEAEPIASDVSIQDSKEIINDPSLSYYIIRYRLGTLQAGASIDFPIELHTKTNGSIPNGSKLPITMLLTDVGGNNLVDPLTHVFTLHTYEPSIEKQVLVRSSNTNMMYSADGVEINAGEEDPNKAGYLSTNLDELSYVEYQFSLRNTDNDYGKRLYGEMELIDTLPEGAVFVQEANPGWVYDSLTHTAKYVYTYPSGREMDRIDFTTPLKLKFPGFKIGELPVNKINMKATQYDKAEYEDIIYAEDSIIIELIEDVPVVVDPPTKVNVGKSGTTKAPGGKKVEDSQGGRSYDQTWSFVVQALSDSLTQSEYVLKDVEVLDYNLDSRLKYKSMRITTVVDFVGTIDIIVTYNDDTTLELAKNVDPSTLPTFNLDNGDEIKTILFKFSDGSYLFSYGHINYEIVTELKDKNAPVIADPNKISEVLTNSADFKSTYTNNNGWEKEFTSTSTPGITYQALNPQIRFTKDVYTPSGQTTFMMNDVISYKLSVDAAGFDIGKEAEVKQIIDILPVGLEYQAGSARISINTTKINTQMQVGNLEPKVIYNYKGTGKTALLWDLKSFSSKVELPNTLISIFDDSEMTSVFEISYKTKITNMTKIGNNNNSAYLFSENYDEVKPYLIGEDSGIKRELVSDSSDWDNDGSTTDQMLKDTATIIYTPPFELIIKKEVKGSLDDNFMLPPGTGLSEIGSQMSYRFILFNNTITSIETIDLLDFIPTINDLTVSEDLTQSPIRREERGATFKLTLSGPISVPTGYKVYYNTNEPPQAAVGALPAVKDYYNSTEWEETVTDYSKVVAFKVVLLPGYTLNAGAEETFEVMFDIPKDYTLDEEDQVVNSFGVSQIENGLSFFESNLATGKIVKYEVEGTVWHDFNENGLYESSEDIFKNHIVQLVDTSGNVVKDLEGKPYETTTDENGYYHFDVYRQGDYVVKVVNPTDYLLTDYNVAENGSHILSDYQTDVFSLNPENKKEIKNAGYYRDTTRLIIKKNLKDTEGELFESDELFDFVVKINDQLYSGPAEYISDDGVTIQEITIVDGKIKIDPKHYVGISSIDKNISYEVSEIQGTKYTAESSSYTGTMDQHDKVVTFVNKVVLDKVSYEVEKVWVNGPAIKSNIEAQLQRNGVNYLDPVTLSTGNWSYEWVNLDATDKYGEPYTYSAKEVNVPDGYTMTSVVRTSKTTITNTFKIEKTEVKIEKVWVGGTIVKPDIEVQLYRNGEAYEDSVTLVNGTTEYIWTNLDKTDEQGKEYIYTVDELTELEDYEKEIDGLVITNTYEEPEDPKSAEIPKEPWNITPGTGVSEVDIMLETILLVTSGLGILIYLKRNREKHN